MNAIPLTIMQIISHEDHAFTKSHQLCEYVGMVRVCTAVCLNVCECVLYVSRKFLIQQMLRFRGNVRIKRRHILIRGVR